MSSVAIFFKQFMLRRHSIFATLQKMRVIFLEDGVRGSVRNSIPGRAPLHITNDKMLLCCVDRKENAVNVHEVEKQGNPLLGTLKGHEAIINTMESIGKKLITGASDKSVIAWNLDNLNESGDKVPMDGYVNVLAVSPEGKIYAAGENKFIACLEL